jgi:hypothetical protein
MLWQHTFDYIGPSGIQNAGADSAMTYRRSSMKSGIFTRSWVPIEAVAIRVGSCDSWLASSVNIQRLHNMKKNLSIVTFGLALTLAQHVQAACDVAVPPFIQKGTGATARSVADKIGESVSVMDFGAKHNGTDDYAAFQMAIDALPASGGRIAVPDGAYVLSQQPKWGARSIFWDFGPGVTFSGAGTGQNAFPAMRTNGGQIAAGPYIQSQSRIPYKYSSPHAGGVAAFQVEMIQPADVVGQSVAMYLGAQGSNPDPNSNVWAGNFLIKAAEGAGGTYQGIELDVDTFSEAALVKGISINGIGTANPDVGLELIRSDATRWNVGVDLMNTITGIKVRNSAGLQAGLLIGDPAAQPSADIVVKQLMNGGDSIVIQRATDTSSAGNALRVVDAANASTIVNIDVAGNTAVKSLALNGRAVAGPDGQVSLGNTQAASATAGTSGPLPAQVAGYLVIMIGSKTVKIPYYDN